MKTFPFKICVVFLSFLSISFCVHAQEEIKTKEESAPSNSQAATTIDTAIFREPVQLNDQDGKPFKTCKALGHPVVYDWNGDGKPDIILGCHTGMDTTQAEVLLLENVGSLEAPKFKWPTDKAVKLDVSLEPAVCELKSLTDSCGCKSGGAFIITVTDWNGDGYFDLLVNTQWTEGVMILLNTAKSKTDPTFRKADKFKEIGKTHGKSSGGGDWNGDGLMDYVFPANSYQWAVYPGKKAENGGMIFDNQPVYQSKNFIILDQKGVPISKKNPWFDYTPYAWNFSGKCLGEAKEIEVVASIKDPDTKEETSLLNFYSLDFTTKTFTLKGTIVKSAKYTRLSIGDLNGDGCMDILYTGGVFGPKKEGLGTEIYVIFGKTKNISANTVAIKQ